MKSKFSKILLQLLIGCAISGSVFGQTVKISVANGSWFNANTWSPPGVPAYQSPSDTVIINTAVTFNSYVDARGVANSVFRINSAGSLSSTTGNTDLSIDRLFNYGTISVSGYLGIGSNTQPPSFVGHNFGDINAGGFASPQNFINEPGAFITVQETGTFSIHFQNKSTAAIICDTMAVIGYFINESGGSIDAVSLLSDNLNNAQGGIISVSGTFESVDTLLNNGSISCGDWLNVGDAAGTTGKFCIGSMFYNVGTITSSVDICDATPNGVNDLNIGYIAPSVTNCMNGPCGVSGIQHHSDEPVSISIYPDPSAGIITVETEISKGEIEIYDVFGKIIFQKEISGQKSEINLTEYPSGIYLLQVEADRRSFAKKLIIQK